MQDLTQIPFRDIHLPDPISWWPLAVGWWLVLAIAVVVLALAALALRKALKATLKKEVSNAFAHIQTSFQEGGDPTSCLSELSSLLRRTMLSQNEKVAGVTGEEWLKLLDRKLDKPEFSEGTGRILLDGPYQQRVDRDSVAQLVDLCSRWVKRL